MDWLPEAMRVLRDVLPEIEVAISSQSSPLLADASTKGTQAMWSLQRAGRATRIVRSASITPLRVARLEPSKPKRARVGTEAARAGHLAAHLDAAEFARDTFVQAHELMQGSQEGAGQPQPSGQQQAPIQGARRAGDGNWYVPDPRSPANICRSRPDADADPR